MSAGSAMVGFLLIPLSMPIFALLPPPAPPAAIRVDAAPAASPVLTLEEALALARAANVKLPAAAAETEIAREKLREARAERWLKVAIEGDFIEAPAGAYDPILTNLGEERLQITGKQPIYDGGEKRAAISHAEAQIRAAEAKYRIAERDLELEVRSRFAEMLSAENEITVRQNGIARLEGYRGLLKSRRAAGQGVSADVLKTEVRLASEQASLVEAQGRRDEARLELNT